VKRNRRAAVEDLWMKTIRDENGNRTTVPSASHGKGSRWRARYVDSDGREHAKQFKIKAHAQRWLDQQTSAIVQGKHVAPRDADIDGSDWSAGRCYPARLLGSNGKLSTPRMKLVFISFGSPAMKSGIWRCSSRNSDRSIDLARWVPRQ
jgi:hypothetical protein